MSPSSYEDAQQVLRRRLNAIRLNLNRVNHEKIDLEKQEQEVLKQIQPKTERCQACSGSGTVVRRDWDGQNEQRVRCESCNGSGRWKEKV